MSLSFEADIEPVSLVGRTPKKNSSLSLEALADIDMV